MTEDERVRARRGQSNTARVGGSAPGGERREGGQEGRSWPPVHTGPMCSLAAASRASTPLLFFRFLRLPLHPIPPPLIRVIRYPPHRRWLPPVIAFTLNTSLSLEEGITITRTTKRCAGTYNRLKGSGIGIGKSPLANLAISLGRGVTESVEMPRRRMVEKSRAPLSPTLVMAAGAL